MLKLASLAGALALAVAGLAGCAGGVLSPTATADIQTALSTACPIVAAASAIKLNKTEAAALNTLKLACPPNAPPTNEAVVIADIVQAYTLLKPLIK